VNLDDLYQEVILDHNRRPRNFRRLASPTHHAEGYNPLCGDRVSLFARVEDGRLADLAFEGSGCAISQASASLMTDRLKGCTVEEARELFERFHRMVTSSPESPVEGLGKLEALAGVRRFPVRVKCASLPWHTLKAALDRQEAASTE
jgi:nitrogen fixation NifU-like protein